MTSPEVEAGIRSYLESLTAKKRPTVDKEAVRQLKAQVRGSTDVLEKLRLLAQLEIEQKGRIPQADVGKELFIAEAKGWAEANHVTVTAFQSLGVPDDVLREAGFTVTSRSAAQANAGGSGSRAPRMSLDEVATAATGLGSPWKLSELAAAIHRDGPTTRNYVMRLIEAGRVVVVGEDPQHNGRGRAAKLYRLA